MTAKVKILTFVGGGCALIGLGFVPLIHDPRPGVAAHAETERFVREAKTEQEAKIRELKIKLIYLRDGEAAGDLYLRCTDPEPPKKSANQKRCQALLTRLQKEDAADAAASAKAKDNW